MILKIIKTWLEKRRTYDSPEASPNKKALICQNLFVFSTILIYKTTITNTGGPRSTRLNAGDCLVSTRLSYPTQLFFRSD